MKLNRQESLAQRLDGLGRNEKHKLYKQAARMRKAAAPRKRPDDDDDGGAPKMRRASLDDYVLRLLEQEAPAPPDDGLPTCVGTVVGIGPSTATVQIGGQTVGCRLPEAIARVQQSAIAVGDEVEIDRSAVVRVLPRRTKLSRTDPHVGSRERVLVANVDLIVVVVSVRTPALHPRLIDRYLVAIEQGGAAAAICVNKLDLMTTSEERDAECAKLGFYEAIGIPVVRCSAAAGEGLDDLRALLAGKTVAFVGHSGVGKSSILNALAPELALRAAPVIAKTGKGRHTTTASALCDCGDGTRIVDTPGIRAFGLDVAGPAELAFFFPEFEGWRCRFGNCTHLHEPGCGVKAAVEAGLILAERYEAYRRLA